MFKLLVVLAVTAILAVLAVGNLHHVPVQCIWTEARVRLSFVVATAFLLGVISTVIFSMLRNVMKKQALRRKKEKEEEEFFKKGEWPAP